MWINKEDGEKRRFLFVLQPTIEQDTHKNEIQTNRKKIQM